MQKDEKPDSWMTLLKGMRSTLKEKRFKQVIFCWWESKGSFEQFSTFWRP